MEAIQLSAMRNITGNKLGTSHFGLYRELDLPTLKTRRYSSRMIKFFEVLNRDTEGRLNRRDFGTVDERNPYSTRHGRDLAIQVFNTELYRTSFRHLCISDWNALPDSLRAIREKSTLKLRFRPKSTPDPYYGIELTRWSSILLSRIRCGNSDLNANLYRRNLVDSPLCECGESEETEIHYLLYCQTYAAARTDARRMVPVGAWNTKDLLHGSGLRYSGEENRTLCLAVQQFIISSGRFNV